MTFDPALKTFLRDRCANETLFTPRGDRKGALRMAAPLSLRVRFRCGSGRLGRPGAPGSVRAGDRCLDHLGAAARADRADLLLDRGAFDDLFLDAQQAALIDLDRLGDGIVFGADE